MVLCVCLPGVLVHPVHASDLNCTLHAILAYHSILQGVTTEACPAEGLCATCVGNGQGVRYPGSPNASLPDQNIPSDSPLPPNRPCVRTSMSAPDAGAPGGPGVPGGTPTQATASSGGGGPADGPGRSSPGPGSGGEGGGVNAPSPVPVVPRPAFAVPRPSVPGAVSVPRPALAVPRPVVPPSAPKVGCESACVCAWGGGGLWAFSRRFGKSPLIHRHPLGARTLHPHVPAFFFLRQHANTLLVPARAPWWDGRGACLG
jgi:hypothetical protein